ncbi:MAG: aminoacyl-histidine dipeptidase [Acidobacteriota bacterium]
MSSPLEPLEPKLLWQHFDSIRRTPRPSKHEEQIIEVVKKWASDRGHEVLQDAAGSLCIRVAATPGHEGAPTVVLQGHLDMVCEKNSNVEHDFMTQGIEVDVDGDWVVARGTTLGADNGIGVATAMAVADDPEVVHGPLELLCTIDEETGLTGAKELDASIVSGRIMLTLDTEEDGAIYIGCAGGADSVGRLKVTRRPGYLNSVPVRIIARGLRGGHSGLNIIENRANAIKLTTRVLLAAIEDGLELDLVAIDGGSKHNAIPRETFAVCRVHADQVDALQAIAARCVREFLEEFAASDPELEIVVEALDSAVDIANPINVHARDRVLQLLDALPHGVLSMSREVEGLVETSNNLAVVKTEDEQVTVWVSYRSSIMPALHAVRRQVDSIFKLAGAKVEVDDAYPGWKPNPGSAIVQTTSEVYEKLFGAAPEVKAIHAGLECGLLIEKIPDMDAVSIGPQIENAHSPDERVQISSVQKFYKHVAALLEELA